MAKICKQVFTPTTVKILEENGLDVVLDNYVTDVIKNIRNTDEIFGKKLNDNTNAFSSKQILEELKYRKASEFLPLKNKLEEEIVVPLGDGDPLVTKLYKADENAYVLILSEALRQVDKTLNAKLKTQLVSTVKAIETHQKFMNTMDFFLSDEFARTQSANKQWQKRNTYEFMGLKNAIKQAKLYEDSGGTKGSIDSLAFQTFMGLIANNNFQKGVGLEDLRTANLAKYWFSTVDKTLTKELGANWTDKFKGKELLEKFYEMRQKIAREDNTVLKDNKVVEGNALENKALSKMHEVYQRIMVDNINAGGNLTQLHFADRIQFNTSILKKGEKVLISQDEFVKDMVNALDDLNILQLKNTEKLSQEKYTKQEILNMPDSDKMKLKTRIAEDVYQSVTNFRNIDLSRDGNISNYLLFKTGAEEYKIRTKYTTEYPAESLFGQFRRLSDDNAITKLFGKNPDAFIKEFRGQLKASPKYKQFADSEGFKVFASHLRASSEPSMLNKTMLGRAFTFMRNINVGHLGWIVLDQLMVEPGYAFSRLSANSKKITGKTNLTFGIHPLMANKYQRQIAKEWGLAIENYIGATKMRFYHTHGDSLSAGKWLGRSEKFANAFLRRTGSSYMSDGQAAIGLSILRSNVSDMLNEDKMWKQLTPAYRRELSRHGITEQDYNQTRQMWKRGIISSTEGDSDNAKKLFDVFLIPDEIDKRNIRLAGLRDKWHKYFSSNVDGLARIRAGDMERMRLNLYATDDQARGVIGALLKTITQFKSFSFAVGRRFHGKELQDGGKLGVLYGMLPIVATTMLGAIAYVQTKEIMNGRNPYRFDDAELYKMAITRTPFLGVLAVVPFTEMLIQNMVSLGFNDELFTAKNFRDDAFRNILGPVFDQYTDLAADTFGIPRTLQTYGLVEGTKKTGVKIAKDIAAIFAPVLYLTHPLLSGFRYQLIEMLEEAWDPEGYYRKVKKREKYAREERYNKRFEQNWVRDLPGGR